MIVIIFKITDIHVSAGDVCRLKKEGPAGSEAGRPEEAGGTWERGEVLHRARGQGGILKCI